MASPLIVIVGETASGKSRLAHALAQHFGGEIISADSWAVYKGFDIGTAKPSATEQAEVVYHLIDVAEPADGFNAVLFQAKAQAAINDITSRQKLPILAGGTGLYIDSVVFDYGFLPATDPALRHELNELSLPELLDRTRAMSLDTTGIDLRNKRRVIRLIENNGVRPTRGHLRPQTLILGIPSEREDLIEQVTRRVDAMLLSGLEQETKRLARQYGWQIEAMRGVGYAQWKAYFAGSQTVAETRDKIIKATLDLAKRQRTWFKRNKSIHWLLTEDKFQESVELITTFLDN